MIFLVISVIERDCSADAFDIRSTVSVIFTDSWATVSSAWAAVSAIPAPCFTDLTDFSINSAVLFDASALFPARLRISSATTAKPLPASPALAASTAAFSASRFV